MSAGPTRHFTWRELGDPPRHLRPHARKLARCLERLRAANDDRPLVIVSGYRNARHNASVGGATRSQHLLAAAADIPRGYATVQEAIDAGFTGIGSSGPWAIHVDVRPGPLARWRY